MTRKKSVLLWVFSVVFMMSIAMYQRMTGPTYPVRGEVLLNSHSVKFKLSRSHGGKGDGIVELDVPDKKVTGSMDWRRFKSNDQWKTVSMERKGNALIARIPHQPPAGKVMYRIFLKSGEKKTALTKEPVVIRFKGAVPPYILIPHIIFAFLSMCFSTRTGLEAWFCGPKTYTKTVHTCICFLIGILTLGPIVQKYAFGAFWTGWPMGHDLTDNKSAVAMFAWIIAWWKLRKNKDARWWVISASLILLAVYMIPHSVLGSEIDYTK